MPSLVWPEAIEPWQALFLILGLPGFPLALLIAASLRESRPTAAASRERPSAKPLIRLYRSDWRFYCVYTLAIALSVMLLNAHIAWLPAALMRAHGIDESAMGLSFGPVYLIAGALGTLTAGAVISRVADARMAMRTLRFMRLCALALILPAIFAPLAPTLITNLALLAVAVFLTSAIVSMSSIPLQVAAPHALRAQTIATTTLAASLLGTGLGPLLVGALSDAFSGTEQPLSNALAVIAAATVPAVAVLMTGVIRHVARTQPDGAV
jgi:predicted MFS family arabinose efflux permease